MNFEIDSETYRDLEIFSTNSGGDILFSTMNRTKTEGGKRYLKKLMQEPSCDFIELTKKRDLIKFFYTHKLSVEFKGYQVDLVEHYLEFGRLCLRPNFIDAIYNHLHYKINPNEVYYRISTGIKELLRLIRTFSIFNTVTHLALPEELQDGLNLINKILGYKTVNKLFATNKNPDCFDINQLDSLFRKAEKETMLRFLAFVYKVDVYTSLSEFTKITGWCFPEYRQDASQELVLEGLAHPALTKPVQNNFCLGDDKVLVYLTGPNMAGKSSFLKALGLSIYLSHIGFPVPADKMVTPIFKGLITTINLPDSIHEGLSHFAREVKRVKKVADKLYERERLFVIFDELFRGTNVQDALEATSLITATLAQIKKSKIIISSHFSEVANKLADTSTISFNYFDCEFIDDEPAFSYKIKEGFNQTRLGMYILTSYNVFSTLKKAVEK